MFDLVRTRVKSGDVRALAITGEARDPELPDVPTIGEAGYPAVTSTSFTGIVAPPGTPRVVVTVFNAKLNELHHSPEFQARMKSFGLVPKAATPEEFAAYAPRDRDKHLRDAKASPSTPDC